MLLLLLHTAVVISL